MHKTNFIKQIQWNRPLKLHVCVCVLTAKDNEVISEKKQQLRSCH